MHRDRKHLKPLLHGLIAFAVAVCCMSTAAGQSRVARLQPPAFAASSGKQIYQANCAACHGQDGRGSKPETTGLDLPLPDFTECAFSSREAERDWAGIVHQGGPVRAFDERMPAFGGVLTETDIIAVVRYVKRFCSNDSWPPGELNFPRAILTEKAYPENELLLISGVTLEGPVDVSGKLIYEQRIGARSQFEVIAPFGVHRRSASERSTTGLGRWGRGLGDVAFGFKHVVFHQPNSGTIASLGAELAIPTGSPAEGIGKDTYILEPFMTLDQQLSTLGFVQLQAGTALPFDESRAAQELYGRIALGRIFTYGQFGRIWVPMFEVQSVHELGAAAPTTWDFLPQIQLAVSKRKHVRANFGVLLPMNDLATRPMQAMGYLLWDWYDGGLDEGW
jgi:mono/diheme cytochrome c family protein